MQMSFTADDEAAFQRRRAALTDDFAAWVEHSGAEADPSDAGMLLDWKFGYQDGELGHWTVADVEEFLLEWCPRKVSSPPKLAARIPLSVAAFVDFLAHSGLLAPASQAPVEVRGYCERIVPRFQQKMSDPANFGMAKSLLSGGGAPEGLLAELGRLTGADPEQVLEMLDEQRQLIGPVRLPSADEHLESLQAARTFRQVRGLAEQCAPPGLPTTTAGDLRLADAGRLAAELETGDRTEPAGPAPQSMSELPALSWVVQLALACGAVAADGQRLVAEPGFAALPEPDAYRRTVTAAVAHGLTAAAGRWTNDEREFLDATAPQLLAELLSAHAGGEPTVPVTELIDMVDQVAQVALDSGPVDPLEGGVVGQLEALIGLGVLHDAGPDGSGELRAVALTPAGVTVAADVVGELLGVEVVPRPDPGTADATAMAAALLLADRDEAEADLATWFATQPDPAAAAGALLAELVADDQEPAAVLAGLDLAGTVLGERADAAAQPYLDGPHEPLVTTWLLTRGALDPDEVDPHRALTGMVAVAAAMIDVDGPAGAVEFVRDSEDDQVLELLEQLWRLDHPRVAEVLDGIGTHHPNKRIAKAARKNLMRYRSRRSR